VQDALTIVEAAEQTAGNEAVALQSQIQLIRGEAFLVLDRLDEADEAIEVGLRAAREQGLPYEEARLLQMRSRRRAVGSRVGGDPDPDATRADEILAAIGALQR
jgi:hypothetical protein